MVHPLARIYSYFKTRGIPLAQGSDAYIFLVSEIGEVGDALMRMPTDKGWIRNNEDKAVALPDELADAYMMLWVLADSYGVDLDIALKNKLDRKLQEHERQSATKHTEEAS